MPNYHDIRGTSESAFKVGLTGPQVKNNGGIAEIRNTDDSAYAVLRVANPVGDQDAVNYLTFKTKKGNVIVKGQADTSVSIPDNTATERFLVVTVPGNGASIGDLLYDDGSGSGSMSIILADDGRTIFVTEALTGGNVEFKADGVYGWDGVTSTWILQSTIGDATGSERIIKFAVALDATTTSVEEIPANAEVYRTEVEITTAYSGGATFKVGQTGDDDLLIDSAGSPSRINAQAIGSYNVTNSIAWGGSQLPVLASVGGTPAAGAAVVRVWFAVPNG